MTGVLLCSCRVWVVEVVEEEAVVEVVEGVEEVVMEGVFVEEVNVLEEVEVLEEVMLKKEAIEEKDVGARWWKCGKDL